MRTPMDMKWFGPQSPLSQLEPKDAEQAIRNAGDTVLADELAASITANHGQMFGIREVLGGILNRIVKTTSVCGVLPSGGKEIVPVALMKPKATLRGKKLKITLEGLHVAKYPGHGRHNLLFDFAIQVQQSKEDSNIFHYNAKFQASDGETVPIHNFPLFYDLQPSDEGITFGFQTVNVSSEFEDSLLGFLDGDDFKKGLALATTTLPVLSQISAVTVGLTKWLGNQSKNTKVQEFRQGLDLSKAATGNGLVEGTYIVAQLPLEHEHEWNWSDWRLDPTLVRLVRRDDGSTLEFNHLMFGARESA